MSETLSLYRASDEEVEQHYQEGWRWACYRWQCETYEQDYEHGGSRVRDQEGWSGVMYRDLPTPDAPVEAP